MPNFLNFFTNSQNKTDLTQEEIAALDKEYKKAWAENVRGGFGALTLYSLMRFEIPNAALFFLGFCLAEQSANFTYNNRDKAISFFKWVAKDGANLVKNQVTQLPIFNRAAVNK